jgi:hypothetical protein
MTVKVEHRIGVAAPAHVIWELISDLAHWKDWNPLYSHVDGKLGFGAPLTLTVTMPGQEPRTIRPIVESWTPDELIHWRLKLMAGLVTSIRYIEIEKLTDTGCIFSNGEIFDGFLGRRLPRATRRNIRAGFEALNEAVKTRAEAAWRAQQGSAA